MNSDDSLVENSVHREAALQSDAGAKCVDQRLRLTRSKIRALRKVDPFGEHQ
jgi:hypothetical protein